MAEEKKFRELIFAERVRALVILLAGVALLLIGATGTVPKLGLQVKNELFEYTLVGAGLLPRDRNASRPTLRRRG